MKSRTLLNSDFLIVAHVGDDEPIASVAAPTSGGAWRLEIKRDRSWHAVQPSGRGAAPYTWVTAADAEHAARTFYPMGLAHGWLRIVKVQP